MRDTKYVLIIGDGMADAPIAALGGRTPLAALTLPAFDALAGGTLGLARTVPPGVPPGSDTAILSIFGYDPRTYYTGRSVLEAAGVGVFLQEGEVSLRLNLCAQEGGVLLSHNGGGVAGAEAVALMEALVADERFSQIAKTLGLRVTISDTFRHIGVLRGGEDFRLTEPHNVLGERVDAHYPQGAYAEELTALMRASVACLDAHPVNAARRARGQLPVNLLWCWGPGRAAKLPSFPEKYGHAGAVVSAVPLVWGIAALAGLQTPKVTGATGELDTNYAGKAQAALAALRGGADFACVHVEAPDEMAHAGDLERKCEAIRRVERLVCQPILDALPGIDRDFRVLLMPDHPTLLHTRTHDASPVPYALYDSRAHGAPRKFSEETAAKGDEIPGTRLMDKLFERS